MNEAKTDFFDDPKQKPSVSADSSELEATKPVKEKPSDALSEADFMGVWDTETEYREPKKTGAENEDEEDQVEEDDFELPGEAAEFAADLATNANQEGMARLLRWMHGEGTVEQYKTNNESLLRKGWHRFFLALNIKISKEKGIIFANLLAFGWSLGIGIWKLVGRIINRTFTWPWSRKNVEVTDVENEPQPVYQPQPQPQPKVQVQDPDDFPEAPLKVCKQTGVTFKPGTGFPKNPKHPEFDSYASRGAYASYTNHERKKKSDAKEKEESAAEAA